MRDILALQASSVYQKNMANGHHGAGTEHQAPGTIVCMKHKGNSASDVSKGDYNFSSVWWIY